jgi:DNA-binding PadR family transcriptional regulator
MTENRRRAKYYRLTAAGGRALQEQATAWSALVRVFDQVAAAAAETEA